MKSKVLLALGSGVACSVMLAVSAPSNAAAEHYTVDASHTFPSFEFPHMGISIWRGKFDRTSGSITLDRAAHTGEVDITVETASINFGLDAMDVRARSDSYLKTMMFPSAHYQGKIVFSGDTPTAVDGTLTLMGVTRPLKLTMDSFKCINRPGPQGAHEACGSEVEGVMHWGDFGMAKFPDGSDELRLHIQVEGEKA